MTKRHLVTVYVEPDTHKQIKDVAIERNVSISSIIMSALSGQYGIVDKTVRNRPGQILNKQDEPPRVHGQEPEQWLCPVCKSPMEVVDRRDRVDVWNELHLHSQDVQLECTACSPGMSVTANIPWPD